MFTYCNVEKYVLYFWNVAVSIFMYTYININASRPAPFFLRTISVFYNARVCKAESVPISSSYLKDCMHLCALKSCKRENQNECIYASTETYYQASRYINNILHFARVWSIFKNCRPKSKKTIANLRILFISKYQDNNIMLGVKLESRILFVASL